MTTLNIPFIGDPHKHTIQDAIGLLDTEGRSGLVVGGEGGSRLLFLGALLDAQDKGAVSLADVFGGPPVDVKVEDPEVRRRGGILGMIVAPVSTESGQAYEPPVGSVAGAVVTSATATEATIFVRDAALGIILGNAVTYKCNGTPRHRFPDAYGNYPSGAGAVCPRYPECSLAGGGQPTVSPGR
jgi:hypothetical protein